MSPPRPQGSVRPAAAPLRTVGSVRRVEPDRHVRPLDPLGRIGPTATVGSVHLTAATSTSSPRRDRRARNASFGLHPGRRIAPPVGRFRPAARLATPAPALAPCRGSPEPCIDAFHPIVRDDGPQAGQAAHRRPARWAVGWPGPRRRIERHLKERGKSNGRASQGEGASTVSDSGVSWGHLILECVEV
jgi:hypothetical protein